MTKFEEEFNYLIELSGKVLIGQVDAEAFEKNRVSFFEKYETDQQQALPVVPEWLYEEINHFKSVSKHPTVDVAFGVADAIVAVKNRHYRDKLYDYLFCGRQDECNQHQAIFALAFITGKYEVEKPQLFYLRDELTGQFLAKDNQFKDKDRYFFWTGADPLTHSIGTAWKLTFTKQEIDSMETGSYEQIEVTE